MIELLNAIYIFAMALIFAFMEIEIEGKNGWAKKLPTWYKKSGFSKLFSILASKKPLTGYHLFIHLFIILIFHAPFFFGLSWTPLREITAIVAYMTFMIVEDFLWFAFNPAFGLKNFKKKKVWWHGKSEWIGGLFPTDYLKGTLLILIITYLASIISKSSKFFYSSMEVLGLVFFMTAISLLFVPIYKKWYKNMRKLDESKLFNRKVEF